MGNLYGLKLIEIPGTLRIKRSWKTRLFSRPWRPFEKISIQPNPGCPPLGEYYKTPDSIMASAATIRQIRDAVNAEQAQHLLQR